MTVATMPERGDFAGLGDTSLARWIGVLAPAAQLADRIADTSFVPEAMRGDAAMVTAAIMYGDELGVGPMQALSSISVIKGKPSPSSELMRALVFRAGHSLRVIKSDGSTCRVAGQRSTEREPTVIEWTIDMARAAGLLDSNPTWRRYPRAMLLARATSELCRVMFPDVVKGLSHVIDDDSSAQDYDEWASTVTGTAPEQERKSVTVSRKRGPQPVTDVDLPPVRDEHGNAPIVEPVPQQAPDGSERLDEWPAGVSQPPLPAMPPQPDLGPAVGGPPFTAEPPRPAAPPTAAPEPMPSDDAQAVADESEPAGRKLMATMHMYFNDLGIGKEDRAKRLAVTSTIVGRQITTSNELTRREGFTVVRILNDVVVGVRSIDIDPHEPFGIAIDPPADQPPREKEAQP